MKNFLILDLDETFVHTFQDGINGFNQASTIPSIANRLYSFDLDGEFYWGILRPYARDFVKKLQKHYYIAVWSAGEKDYVHKIVDILFPPDSPPEFIWHRSYCEEYYNHGIKLRKKPLSKLYHLYNDMNHYNTVIIDDRSDVCDENTLNHVCIPPYNLDYNNLPEKDPDNCLLQLYKHLIHKYTYNDVRELTSIQFV